MIIELHDVEFNCVAGGGSGAARVAAVVSGLLIFGAGAFLVTCYDQATRDMDGSSYPQTKGAAINCCIHGAISLIAGLILTCGGICCH